jgi:hypothetical protein
VDDGNWHDDMEKEENLGFQQGSVSHIGGVVDMKDNVYVEFEEEDVSMDFMLREYGVPRDRPKDSIIFDAPCLFLHHLHIVSLHLVALLYIFRN